jgi:hypothetical protein
MRTLTHIEKLGVLALTRMLLICFAAERAAADHRRDAPGGKYKLQGARDVLPLLSAVLVLPLGVIPGLAQVTDRQEPSRSNDVEFRFGDSSAVRMVLLQEALDVETKYGQLKVPAKEIRRIEFGIHLAPELRDSIGENVKRLASENHPERERAGNELVNLGFRAYPALMTAAKSEDPEVVRRAEEAVKRIRAKVPGHLLRQRETDRIETTEFTIVGRITSPSLKARSAYFGEAELKITDLYSIRSLSSGGNFDLTVDAAKYGSAHDQWLNTGIDVENEMDVVVTASGKVDLWVDGTGQYVTGPNGYPDGGAGFRGVGVPGAQRGGTLQGRIGENGEVFVIGERYHGKASREGKLYLHITPSPWGNPSAGSYNAHVATGVTP